METGSTLQPGVAAALRDRRAPATESDILHRSPWPVPARVAGYITIVSALVVLLAHESVYHHAAVFPTIALTGAIMAGYHVISGGKPPLRPYQGLAVIVAQLLCAIAIVFMVNGQSTGLILLYILAAELQFVISFRAALAATAGLWLVTVVVVELVSVHLSASVTPPVVVMDAAGSFCGFVFVAALTRSAVMEVAQRRQATVLFDQLATAHAQLRSYADSVEALAVARERNRLARDIHDTLGHYLTVINVQIEAAQKLRPRDAARSEAALATAKTLAGECLAEVRRSVSALRPAALDGVALPEAIARLIDDLRRASGVAIHVEGQGAGTLPPAVDVVVYRVIQEALTNVCKHAQARNVWLRTEWGSDWFVAGVRDDGRGAPQQPSDAGSAAPGFGLRGMRERVAAVGGTLEITTAPGAGFCVLLRVPCAPEPWTAGIRAEAVPVP